MRNITPLGDGVFAINDDLDPKLMWLATNDPQNPSIALEPQVLKSLMLWLWEMRPDIAKEMAQVVTPDVGENE